MDFIYFSFIFNSKNGEYQMNCECEESFMTLPDVPLLLSTVDFSLEGDINQNPNDHETFPSESKIRIDFTWNNLWLIWMKLPILHQYTVFLLTAWINDPFLARKW